MTAQTTDFAIERDTAGTYDNTWAMLVETLLKDLLHDGGDDGDDQLVLAVTRTDGTSSHIHEGTLAAIHLGRKDLTLADQDHSTVPFEDIQRIAVTGTRPGPKPAVRYDNFRHGVTWTHQYGPSVVTVTAAVADDTHNPHDAADAAIADALRTAVEARDGVAALPDPEDIHDMLTDSIRSATAADDPDRVAALEQAAEDHEFLRQVARQALEYSSGSFAEEEYRTEQYHALEENLAATFGPHAML